MYIILNPSCTCFCTLDVHIEVLEIPSIFVISVKNGNISIFFQSLENWLRNKFIICKKSIEFRNFKIYRFKEKEKFRNAKKSWFRKLRGVPRDQCVQLGLSVCDMVNFCFSYFLLFYNKSFLLPTNLFFNNFNTF